MASAAEQLAANFNFGAISKAKELRSRILFTLGALIVARIGTYIPMPGIDPAALALQINQSGGGILDVAPYLAKYNDLNTWIMFQVDHHPAKHDHFVATPLIRFFYKTYLFEVGYSSNQHIMVNWQIQF